MDNSCDAEPLAPSWQITVPAIQFSEFEKWSEVAHLFAPLYADTGLPQTLVAEIDQLAEAYPEDDVRAAECLRFVQQKLRYFALSLGEGGLVPRQIETIWNSRLGDCKDAARLYVAGAQRLGLDACAAIVSTAFGPALDTFLPSANIFNHCIVRLSLHGRYYWLDPTQKNQCGSLDNIFQPHAGYALALMSDASDLDKLPESGPIHCVNWNGVITFGQKRNSSAKFSRKVIYSSWAADIIRNRVADQGAAEYSKSLLKEAQSQWPKTIQLKDLLISDNNTNNILELESIYEISDCWSLTAKGDRLEFKAIDSVIAVELNKLGGTERQAPIYLGWPRKLTRTLRLEMPTQWVGEGWQDADQLPGYRYFNRFEIAGRTITSTRELEINQRSLPATQASRYKALVEKLHTNVITIWGQESFGRIRSPRGRILGMSRDTFRIVWFAVWAFIILLNVIFSR